MKYDYLKQVLKVLGLAIVLLLIIGHIPNLKFEYKHFSLLSDIQQKDTVSNDTDSLRTGGLDHITDSSDSTSLDSLLTEQPVCSEDGIVSIEDFSPDKQALKAFFDALQNNPKKEPVRIGFLGDSFIEGDIITSELRKQMQAAYGGTGIGFIPIVSPVAQCRKNIQQTAIGWTTQSMVYYKKADWTKFCLTGFYYRPAEGATLDLKFNNKDRANQASFFFINEKNTKITVEVSGGAPVEYSPEPSGELQSILLENSDLTSLKIKVSKVEGFTGIGLFLNNTTGVYVDNFSVRGSSGSVMITVNKGLTEQLSQKVPYDLLVIQYGLNVMTTEKTMYTSYRKLMINAINHLKECYPGVPLLLMSVGDRSSKGASGLSTHPGVLSLINAQREMAKETGIAFWNTYEAMGGEHSMIEFVKHTPPMAAKDYTHINYLGGDKVADEMFKSLMKEKARLMPR